MRGRARARAGEVHEAIAVARRAAVGLAPSRADCERPRRARMTTRKHAPLTIRRMLVAAGANAMGAGPLTGHRRRRAETPGGFQPCEIGREAREARVEHAEEARREQREAHHDVGRRERRRRRGRRCRLEASLDEVERSTPPSLACRRD